MTGFIPASSTSRLLPFRPTAEKGGVCPWGGVLVIKSGKTIAQTIIIMRSLFAANIYIGA